MNKLSIKLTIITLCIFICTTFYFFINRYVQLSKQLKEEQTIYIDEIQHQLGQTISIKKYYQKLATEYYIRLLNSTPLNHFQEVNQLLLKTSPTESHTKMLLVSDKGKIFNSYGEEVTLSNAAGVQNFLHCKEQATFSTQIDYKNNFLIVVSPLTTPLQLDQNNIIGIMQASSTTFIDFGENFDNNLLYDKGYIFVVDSEAQIIMAQEAAKNSRNFISFLEQRNVTADTLNKIRTDLSRLGNQKYYINIGDTRWMINYEPIPNTKWLTVIMLPATITGADTYPILKETIIGFSLIAVCILLLLTYVFYYFHTLSYKREQEKNKNLLHMRLLQETSKAKEDFFSKMSHDLRTPLHAMIGLNHLALDNIHNPEQASAYLKQSAISENYLLNLLNGILDMAKMNNGKITIKQKPFDFLELIEETRAMIEPQAKEQGITFQIIFDAHAVTRLYLGDALRIKQILMNLLSNAIKFTPTSGFVKLQVEISPLSIDADEFIISVCDNGIGMSETFLEKIFDPFEQEDNENQHRNYLLGSGLGLSIVKGLTEAMNGTVQVHSKLHKGTSFIITIPLKKVSEQKQNPNTELSLVKHNQLSDLKNKRILLVEDTAMNRIVLTNILTQKFNLFVDCAENGKIAIQKFETHPIDYYHLILMDIRMPIIDGYEATKIIRASKHSQAKSIPIVAMSANAFEEDIQYALECGMNVHLSKPINFVELENALLEFLT